QYYVPLRGFDETTSDEVYNYLTSSQSIVSSPMKNAKGRRSKADNPIATIGNMAESGIMQGNRNLMKQKFLTMVENHPSDIAALSEVWLKFDEEENGWVYAVPKIEPNATAEEVAQITEDWQKQMERLAAEQPKMYAKANDLKMRKMPYRVLKPNLLEHQVLVKRRGKEYIVNIMGNPRAAQAVNGLTNPNASTNVFIQGFEKANRFMAANFTNRNPSFVLSNLVRDGVYANSTVWVKESPAYAMAYHRNWAKALTELPAIIRAHNAGKLDMSNPIHKMFRDFLKGGGETGYTYLSSVEDYKDRITKELDKMQRGKYNPKNALDFIDKQLGTFNQWAEGVSRFAAYMTSIESGRSQVRAIHDAKEISVNFNKKGAGSKTMGKNDSLAIKAQAGLAQAARGLYIFWNAGVQGLTNASRLVKHNPKKFTAMGASFLSAGMLIPLVNSVLASMAGDDENDYWNLPEWVRRNNICIYAGDAYVTIPLPIELRSLFGMGDLITGQLTGNTDYSAAKTAKKTFEQVAQILPLDPTQGDGGLAAFWPSYVKPIVEVYTNKDWTGIPIYKDTPYNKNNPDYTKAYKGTSKTLIGIAEGMNTLTGGNKHKKGMVDINPAAIEHLISGYLGGAGKTITDLYKLGFEFPFGADVEVRNVPIVSKFVRASDDRATKKNLTNRYFELVEKYKVFGDEMSGWKKDSQDKDLDAKERIMAAQKYNELRMSPEGVKYENWKEGEKVLKKLKEEGLGDDQMYYDQMQTMVDMSLDKK
ncbi:MAG: hypothetical protein HUJ98_04075, partial [Bacteroidaceae bacterium]|nr:hypothetical protein [Bacteroidaceae bacterium]